MARKITLVLGHPDRDSFCHALAVAYVEHARAAGHDVRCLALGDLTFDPVLRQGYRAPQALELDLIAVQEAIRWCDHLVLVFPLWWGAMPALLKGMIDRVFLPGFAFRYRKGSVFWDRLLSGRSARVLVTMDTPPWYYRWLYRRPVYHQLRRTILEFSGIRPVEFTSFGPIRNASTTQLERWVASAAELGDKGL